MDNGRGWGLAEEANYIQTQVFPGLRSYLSLLPFSPPSPPPPHFFFLPFFSFSFLIMVLNIFLIRFLCWHKTKRLDHNWESVKYLGYG